MLVELLRDAEPEVRCAAAYRLADIVRMLSAAPVQRAALVASINTLVDDDSDHVRAAVASVLLGLVPALGASAAIESVLPLFLRLIKDRSPQIRLNALARVDALATAVPIKTVIASLLPAVSELAADKNWRVRAATIVLIPMLARQLGAEAFEGAGGLIDLMMRWLLDPVFAIREAAMLNFRATSDICGVTWTERVILPRFFALVAAAGSGDKSGASSTYQLRMTMLCAFITFSDALSPAVVTSRLLPTIVAFSDDKVPNIRFNAAKALARLAEKVDAAVVSSAYAPVTTSTFASLANATPPPLTPQAKCAPHSQSCRKTKTRTCDTLLKKRWPRASKSNSP